MANRPDQRVVSKRRIITGAARYALGVVSRREAKIPALDPFQPPKIDVCIRENQVAAAGVGRGVLFKGSVVVVPVGVSPRANSIVAKVAGTERIVGD